MLSKSLAKALCAIMVLMERSVMVAAARGIPANQVLSAYNETLNLAGLMVENDIDFTDGLTLSVFSPVNRTVAVIQNNNPLTGRYVTGDANGGFYRAISNYSWVIQTGDQAQDLIATINLPYDPTELSAFQIDPSNTYVAKLSADNSSWVLGDQITVNKFIFKSQVSHLTSIDGEYRLIGRIDPTITGAAYADFGGSDLGFLAGGRQDVEFIDGTRLSVLSNNNLTLSVDLVNTVSQASLPQGMVSLNSFAYVLNTTVISTFDLPQPAIPQPAAQNGSLGAAATAASIQTSVISIIAESSSAVQPQTTFTQQAFGGNSGAGSFNDGLAAAPSSQSVVNRRLGKFKRQLVTVTSTVLGSSPTTIVQTVQPAASGSSSTATAAVAASVLASAAPTSVAASVLASTAPTVVAASGASSPSSTAALAAVASAIPSNSTATAAALGGVVQAATLAFPINMPILMALLAPSGKSNGTTPSQSLIQSVTPQAPLGISSGDATDAVLRSVALQVGRRDVGASNATFTPIGSTSTTSLNSTTPSSVSLSIVEGKLVVAGLTALDGEYVILVPMSGSGSGNLSVSSTGSASGATPPAPTKAGLSFNNGAGSRAGWSASLVWGAAAVVGFGVACGVF